MRRIHKGFTLIELMIVVGIISILAALALPAYQDYMIRSRVSELVLAASSYRASIEEKANAEGALTAAGVGLTITAVGKIAGGRISDDGVITIIGSAAPTSVGANITLVLTPTLNSPSRVITWTCSSGDATQMKYMPPECRHV